MAEQAKRVALEVSTNGQEPSDCIVIDGQSYSMVAPEDLELRQQLWLAKVGRQLKDLGQADVSDKEIDYMEAMLDKTVALILPSLPEAIRAKLKDRHKIAIIGTFTEAAPSPEVTRQTGTPSSPGSSDSTGATEMAGSDAASPLSSGTSS